MIRICDDIKRNTLVPVMIFRDGVTVHVLDGDGQTLRLLALSKESSASGMRAIKVPYPSDGST